MDEKHGTQEHKAAAPTLPEWLTVSADRRPPRQRGGSLERRTDHRKVAAIEIEVGEDHPLPLAVNQDRRALPLDVLAWPGRSILG